MMILLMVIMVMAAMVAMTMVVVIITATANSQLVAVMLDWLMMGVMVMDAVMMVIGVVMNMTANPQIADTLVPLWHFPRQSPLPSRYIAVATFYNNLLDLCMLWIYDKCIAKVYSEIWYFIFSIKDMWAYK